MKQFEHEEARRVPKQSSDDIQLQLDPDCGTAFIQQFYKMYSGQVDSRRRFLISLWICLIIYLPPLAQIVPQLDCNDLITRKLTVRLYADQIHAKIWCLPFIFNKTLCTTAAAVDSPQLRQAQLFWSMLSTSRCGYRSSFLVIGHRSKNTAN